MKTISLVFLFFTLAFSTLAQKTESKSEEEQYNKTVNERAQKIVLALDIPDTLKSSKVRSVIANQYKNLRNIQDLKDKEIKLVKQQTADKQKTEDNIKKIEASTTKKLDQLHKKYLTKLSKELTPAQIDQVKNGMTYGVLPITYDGYQAMIPNLTEDQKKYIKTQLTEAREHAMDAGSSEEKHKWFGKYKGRINNYLSKEGYDLKQEEEGWAKRREIKTEVNK